MRKVIKVSGPASSKEEAGLADEDIVRLVESLTTKLTNNGTFQEGFSLISKPKFTQQLKPVILKWSKERKQLQTLEHILKLLLEVSQALIEKIPVIARDLLMDLVCFCMGVIASSPLARSQLLGAYFQLQTRLQDITQKIEEKKIASGNPYYSRSDYIYDEMVPPEDFRGMTVIAGLDELLYEPEPFLRPNKVIGQYLDGDHYLDVQFRLLRADFDIPLRKAFQQFQKNPREYLAKTAKGRFNSQQDRGVRCYQDVTFSSIENFGKEIIFNLPERFVKKTNWNKSKRFMQGCLVVLSCDNFKTASFAITTSPPFDLQKNFNGKGIDQRGELADGKLRVTIISGDHLVDKTKPYLLLESEAFFEAYRYNLSILQNIPAATFENNPLYELIAKPSSNVGFPSYLMETDECFMIPETLSKSPVESEEVIEAWDIKNLPNLPPREPHTWNLEVLKKHLNMDLDQCIAVRTALTSQISLIQGPPGTGKTYVGLQIAKMLLFNRRHGLIPRSPILFVCHTNHALDQILEMVVRELPKSVKVARVGGQSKSEVLKQFSLANYRGRYGRELETRELAEEAASKRDLVKILKEKVEKVQVETSNLVHIDGIVNFTELDVADQLRDVLPSSLWNTMQNPVWLGLRNDTFEVDDFNVDEIVGRLFSVREKAEKSVSEQLKKVITKEDIEEPAEEEDMDELKENRMVDIEDVIWIGSRQSFYALDMFQTNLSVQACIHEARKLNEKMFQLAEQYNELVRGEQTENRFEKMRAINYTSETTMIQLKAIRNREKLLGEIFGLYKDERLILPDLSKTFYQEDKYVISSNEIMRYPIRIRWAIYFAVVQLARVLSMKRLNVLTNQVNAANEKYSKVRRNLDGTILREMDVIGMTTTGAAKMHDLLELASPKIVIVEEAAEVLEAHIVTSLTDKCEQLILIGDHLQLRPSVNVYQLETKYRLSISLFERLILNGVPHCTLKTQHRMRPEISDLIIGPIYEELHNHPKVYDYPSVHGVKKRMFFINHHEREQSDGDLQSKSNRHEASFLLALCEYLLQQDYDPGQITILTTYAGQMFEMRKMLPDSCKGVKITSVDNYQGEENDIILLSLVRSNTENKVGFVKIDNRICVALSRARYGLFVCGNMDGMVAASGTWKAIVDKLKDGGNIGEELELSCQQHGNLLKVKTHEDFRHFQKGGCGNGCKASLKCGHLCDEQCHGKDQQHERLECKQKCLKTCKEGHPCTAICSSECPPCPHPVLRELPCKHQAKMKCSEDPDTFLCKQFVNKILECGHSLMTNCFVDVASIECQEDVKRILPCGHEHEMECHTDLNTFKCNYEKIIMLSCGDSTKVQCHVPVNTVKCLKPYLRVLNCKHEKMLECWENPANVVCNVVISKKLPCGHPQESPCGSTLKCDVRIEVVNPICSHKSIRPCHESGAANCMETCAKALKCGHLCPKLCHINEDPNHEQFICKESCKRKCISGHPCKYTHECNLKCFPCEEPTKLTLSCGHDLTDVKCSEVKQKQKCTMKVPQVLACGHEQQVFCYMNPGEHKCTTLIVNCKKECPLGHPCSYEHACNEDCPPCETKLIKELSCGHKSPVPCSISPDQLTCRQIVVEKLPCSHDRKLPCYLKEISDSSLEIPEEYLYFFKCAEFLEVECSGCKISKVLLQCYEKRDLNFCRSCKQTKGTDRLSSVRAFLEKRRREKVLDS